MWLVAEWLVACQGDGDKTPDGGTGTGDTAAAVTSPEPSATLALVDAWNLSYDPAPALPTFSVAAGTDFVIAWDTATTDVWGRPLPPVARVDLALRSDAAASVPGAVALAGADPIVATEHWELAEPAATTTPASALSHTGHTFVPRSMAAGQVYVASVGDNEGKTLLAAVVEVLGGADPVALAGATFGDVPTLGPNGPVTAADLGPWTLDWSALTTDAAGAPLDPLALDTLFVAHFADEGSVDLLNPAAADGYWAKYVPGLTSVDPETMNSVAGTAFPGFDTTGVWVVGFRCVDCATALPRFATRVSVE